MPDIQIHDLADFPQWLPVISTWLQEEWREAYSGLSRSEIEQRLAGWLARDRIPTALVAVVGGQVIGTLAIQDQMLTHALPTPVVSDLYVLPQFRRRGVAAKLLRAAEDRARNIGLSKLYMFTQAPHTFYGGYGWNRYRETPAHASTLTVMEKSLTPLRMFQPPPLARRG